MTDPCATHQDCFVCTNDLANDCGWCSALCGGDRGCHAKSKHVPGDLSSTCAHPEDGWTPVANQCVDPCSSLEYCEDCLGFQQRSSQCGWCAPQGGGTSGCQRGSVSGPDSQLHPSCTDWRWKDPSSPPLGQGLLEGMCVEKYDDDCTQIEFCSQCAAAYMNATHRCHFCSAAGASEPNDGRCLSPSQACGAGETEYTFGRMSECPVGSANVGSAVSTPCVLVSFVPLVTLYAFS